MAKTGQKVSAESLSSAAAKLGRKGGTIGGPARAMKLTQSQRQAIARKGGKAKAAKK